MKTIALILAAGRENQMHSGRAKELHQLVGKSLLETTAETLRPLAGKTIVVLGHHAQELQPALPEWCLSCIQDFSLGFGTAKATLAALPLMEEDAKIVITAGDKPCLSPESYRRLLNAVDGQRYQTALLYADVDHPEGYDRVVFDGDGDVKRIAHADRLMPQEEEISSINVGVYCFTYSVLRKALLNMEPDIHHVYHISDQIDRLGSEGHRIAAIAVEHPQEGRRIVSRADLAEATSFIVRRNCQRLMQSGVTLLNPANTYVEGDVEVGRDTIIYPGCVLQRGTRVGERCVLYPGCRLLRTVVGDEAIVEQTIAEDSVIAPGSRVGPYVHLHAEHR